MNDDAEPVILRRKARADLVSQGAEAKVWSTQFLQRDTIVKQRFSKKYRHSTLDSTLTAQRLKAEVRCMLRARKLGIRTPVPYYIDTRAAAIYMERVAGTSVKQALLDAAGTEAQSADMMQQIGKGVAKMHDGGLVHGDLTTSNLMLRASDQHIVFIDFGLAYFSTIPEDKGVDLYVLERALASTHADKPRLFHMIMDAYQAASAQHSATFSRFAEVRQRGRKRSMVG